MRKSLTVAAVALVVAATGGCGGPSAELSALRDQAMASWAPSPGAEPALSSDTDGGTSLGIPVRASLTRLYEVDDVGAAAAFDAALDAATADGWEVETPPRPGDLDPTAVFSKSGSCSCTLAVTLHTDDATLGDVSAPALSVDLDWVG